VARLDPLVRVARTPSLRWLGIGFGAFGIAEWASWVAVLVAAYERGGPTLSGATALLMLVPAGLLAPMLSVTADRYPPRRVLVTSYLAQALVTAVLAVAVAAEAPLALFEVAAVFYALPWVVTRPTQAAIVPQLAPRPADVTAAYVVTGWIESISAFVGPALAAVCLARGGAELALGICAGLSAIGTLASLPLHSLDTRGVAEEDAASAGLLGDLREGIRVLHGTAGLRMIVLLIALSWVVIGFCDVLYAVVAIGQLRHGQGAAGLMSTAFGVGTLAAGALSVLLIGRRYLAPPLLLALGTAAAGMLALLAAHSIVAALVCFGLLGCGYAGADLTGRTFLQRAAPTAVLGRLFGLLEGLGLLGMALGAAVIPALIAVVGVDATFVVSAALLVGAVVIARSTLTRLDRATPGHSAEVAHFHRYPLFAPLDAGALETLAGAATPVVALAGEHVVRQGDPGEQFFLVVSGTAVVTQDGLHVRDLQAGDGFGEIALLRSVPRTATVAAVSDLDLLALDAGAFLLAVTGHAEGAAAADRLVQEFQPTL
jgi:MFS family permease